MFSKYPMKPGYATCFEQEATEGTERELSRKDAARFGEHTRPRVFRPAPSPVGRMLRLLTK